MTVSAHILLYSDDPDAGGVAQYNHALLCALADRGYRVTCVQSRADNPLLRCQAELGVRHVWLDFDTGKDLKPTLINTGEVERILDRTQPDLVVFSNCCPVSNLAAKRAALLRQVPYVIAEGFVLPALAQKFADLLPEIARQYAEARAVIAVSHENLECLHRAFGLPASQGRVIYYGRPACYFAPPEPATRQRLREEAGIPVDAVLCFTAGRLERIKGYQYQLDVIARLRSRPVWPRLWFAWAGPGSLHGELMEGIRQLEVASHVKLLGQRWDIADWLDAADIFVLPSEAEGMPLAIMEAMAKGLPVVASAVSGIPEELGPTGKLIPPPREDSDRTVRELAATIESWAQDADLRRSVGSACRERACRLFREERMVDETLAVIERVLHSESCQASVAPINGHAKALNPPVARVLHPDEGVALPAGDYVSLGLAVVRPDACFPHLRIGDPRKCAWPYLRRKIPHNWYVDGRCPTIGFVSRDEAHLLYNNALQLHGRRALEIGCFLGWSTCHLALAGVEVDAVDPLLAQSEVFESVTASLQAAGVQGAVHLHAGPSPQLVEGLAERFGRRWSVFFIDSEHQAPGPLEDAMVCARFAEPDALILFHDLACPDVGQGLDYLADDGWQTLIYQTAQIMGVAWRGSVQPVAHEPDPRVRWELPEHLKRHRVSELATPV